MIWSRFDAVAKVAYLQDHISSVSGASSFSHYLLDSADPGSTQSDFSRALGCLYEISEQYPDLVKDLPFFSENKVVPLSPSQNYIHKRRYLGTQIKSSDQLRKISEAQPFCSLFRRRAGANISITYRDGQLSSAVTKGDGWTGKDVTNNVLSLMSVPREIDLSNAPSLFVRAHDSIDPVSEQLSPLSGTVLELRGRVVLLPDLYWDCERFALENFPVCKSSYSGVESLITDFLLYSSVSQMLQFPFSFLCDFILDRFGEYVLPDSIMSVFRARSLAQRLDIKSSFSYHPVSSLSHSLHSSYDSSFYSDLSGLSDLAQDEGLELVFDSTSPLKIQNREGYALSADIYLYKHLDERVYYWNKDRLEYKMLPDGRIVITVPFLGRGGAHNIFAGLVFKGIYFLTYQHLIRSGFFEPFMSHVACSASPHRFEMLWEDALTGYFYGGGRGSSDPLAFEDPYFLNAPSLESLTPGSCPFCKSSFAFDFNVYRQMKCSKGPLCPGAVKARIKQFISSPNSAILGINDHILSQLFRKFDINNVSDLYLLSEEDWLLCGVQGKMSARLILDCLEAAKDTTLPHMLNMLGFCSLPLGMLTYLMRSGSIEELFSSIAGPTFGSHLLSVCLKYYGKDVLDLGIGMSDIRKCFGEIASHPNTREELSSLRSLGFRYNNLVQLTDEGVYFVEGTDPALFRKNIIVTGKLGNNLNFEEARALLLRDGAAEVHRYVPDKPIPLGLNLCIRGRNPSEVLLMFVGLFNHVPVLLSKNVSCLNSPC